MSAGTIYAFGTPDSAGQRAYTDQGRTQSFVQRESRKVSQISGTLVRRFTSSSALGRPDKCRIDLPYPAPNMEVLLARSLTSGTSTLSAGMSVTSHRPETLQRTTSEQNEQNLLQYPFELRYGRRYLRSEVPYPLPCDLPELHRQTLRTMLGIQVFGAPVCNPSLRANPPRKVLELGCGTAYWSAMCHDHFAAQGHTDIQWVGLDFAPLAPNLRRQGMNWRFVQHDMRRMPLPFNDNEFDVVVFKDLSMTMPLDSRSEKILVDAIRILKPGGSVECWESDHVVRSLLNTQPPPPPRTAAEQEDADRTATFGLPIGHPFAQAQNKYLQKANKWIEASLDQRKLNPRPATRIAEMLTTEPELRDVGYRRVAIPFGELHWEKEGPNRRKRISNGHDSPMSMDSRRGDSPRLDSANLTPDQAAIRQTALVTVLGQIEAMEPMLKEVSGKNAEEWSVWWAGMMTDLLDPGKGGLVGECLEMGAWWATKAGDPDELDSDDDNTQLTVGE